MAVSLEDVDRLLAESTGVDASTPVDQLRGWRDGLGHLAVLLSYARHVLSVDCGLLRSAAAGTDAELQALVDSLPRVLAAESLGGGWTLTPDAPAAMASARSALEGGADGLLGPHAALARSDLTASGVAARLVGEVETQLDLVSRSREEVEARVRTLQAAILDRYRDGRASVDDWLT